MDSISINESNLTTIVNLQIVARNKSLLLLIEKTKGILFTKCKAYCGLLAVFDSVDAFNAHRRLPVDVNSFFRLHCFSSLDFASSHNSLPISRLASKQSTDKNHQLQMPIQSNRLHRRDLHN